MSRRFGRNQKRRLREAAEAGRLASERAGVAERQAERDVKFARDVLLDVLGAARSKSSVLLGDPLEGAARDHPGRILRCVYEVAERRLAPFGFISGRAFDREILTVLAHEVETTVEKDFLGRSVAFRTRVGDLSLVQHVTYESLALMRDREFFVRDLARSFAAKLADAALPLVRRPTAASAAPLKE